MSKFKKGDYVRALVSMGAGDVAIVKDHIYEVTNDQHHLFDLSVDHKDCGWYDKRFELAYPLMHGGSGGIATVSSPRYGGVTITSIKECEPFVTLGSDAPKSALAHAADCAATATVLGTQVGGSHYTDCAIQPIEYIWANGLGFSEGNIIKYVTRWRSKGGIKDLEKAKHHIALLIEHEQSKEQK